MSFRPRALQMITSIFKNKAPFFVFALGLVVAAGTGLRSESQRIKAADDMLERLAVVSTEKIKGQIDDIFHVLVLLENRLSDEIMLSEKEFDQYLGLFDFDPAFNAALGFGYIERVMRDEADVYVAAQVELGRPQFSIRELEDNSYSDLYVAKFIYPEIRNTNVEGVNYGSEPVRRAGLQRAIDTGELTLTDSIALIQDETSSAGALLIKAFYKEGASISTAAERRAALAGVVYAPIIFSDFFASNQLFDSLVNVEVILTNSGDKEYIIYSESRSGTMSVGSGRSFSHSETIAFGDKNLIIHKSSTPALEAEFSRVGPWTIFLILTLLSAVGALLLRSKIALLEDSRQFGKQAVAELEREKLFWFDLSSISADLYWETDVDFNFVRGHPGNKENTNAAFDALLGQDLKTVLKNSLLNSVDVINRQLQILDEHGTLQACDISIVVKELILTIEISGLPVFDDAGHFRGYRGKGRDVTVQKKQAADTADMASKLTLATNAAQIGIWEYTFSTREVIWSDIMYKLYHTDPSEFSDVYKAWRFRLHPNDSKYLDKSIANSLSGEGLSESTFRIVKPNGEVRHLKGIGFVVRDADGNPLKMVGTNQDITDSTLAKLALEESEAMLKAIIETVPDGLITTDAKGVVILINRAAKAMFQITEAEIVGTHMAKIVPERFKEGHRQGMIRMQEGAALSIKDRSAQVAGLRGDGTEFPLELSVNESGFDSQRMFVGVLRDITSRKADEATMALARQQAESASRAKTEFMSNMTHEIRAPLNAILGLAYLLDQEELDLRSRETVRKIRSSGLILLSLISDILDISKIEAGFMQIEQTPFDLVMLIESVQDCVEGFIGAKNIKMSSSLPKEDVRYIVGDPTRLQQVLMNLGNNAVKFTQAGSIKLVLEVLRNTDDIEYLRFSIADTGIGIDQEMLDTIFQPFAQAETSTTRRFGGTGLGLSICSQLVALMGGKIGVNSISGQGSEFWFSLPLERVSISLDSSLNNESLKVLIVDDSDIALDAVVSIVKNIGWEATTTDSGAIAIAMLLEDKPTDNYPDAVVIDWKMPGMDGLALTKAIRGKIPQPQCPILIMCTADSLYDLSQQPGVELADAILSKPLSQESLKSAVRDAIVAAGKRTNFKQIEALREVRVLVVDDSDINREVAQRILISQGAKVMLAEDGQQAIEWLVKNPRAVDVVLMDLQMPVLGGVEATRRLRKMPEFVNLPIVALTSGVFQSQKEEALNAGMTEFVSKPFDVPLLISLILRLYHESRLSSVAPEDASLLAPSNLFVTSEVMDIRNGLKLWSDMETYQVYLQRFADSYRDAAETISTSLANGDLTRAAALAHKVSGTAASMALPDTQRTALELEMAVSAGEAIEPALAQFCKALAAVIAEIDRYQSGVENHG